MNTLRGHNGELIALALAAVCAWAIAASVLHFETGTSDAIYVPGLAATAAVVTTWVLWRLFAAYGRRLLVLRAAIAGGLAGIAAHPVFMFLVLMRESIAACGSAGCLTDAMFGPGGLDAAVVGTSVFSVMGLVFVGPVTVPVGMLGGVLAVLLSRSNRKAEGEAAASPEEVPEEARSG